MQPRAVIGEDDKEGGGVNQHGCAELYDKQWYIRCTGVPCRKLVVTVLAN